jgi:hypothetical protein
MSHDTNSIFQIGNTISYNGDEWTVVRFVIDHTVLLQKIDEPSTIVRVHASELLG